MRYFLLCCSTINGGIYIYQGKPLKAILAGIDHFLIFGIGMELACNVDLSEGIQLKRGECHLHLP